jgi:excisionase family DNA binding protein
MTKKLLTVDGLSDYLSMPKPTIYTWVCLRKIPAPCIVKLGRSLRFDVEAVDNWVNAQRGAALANVPGCIQSGR